MGIDEPISVVPYNKQWTALFEKEKSILSTIFRETAIEIQHFGSTSVPGMLAKPIIDILVGVRTLELDRSMTAALEDIGYEGFGEAGVEGRLYFRKRKEHAYNLAIVIWKGEQWVNNILIRDYLRGNPDIAKQYSDRKQDSVKKGITTLLAYSNEKADFVYSLLERARQSLK